MDTAKAIELLEKSEHIGILLPEEASLDATAAAETLARILEERGKKVGFLTERGGKENLPQELFRKITSSPLLPKEFIVSINTSLSPVSQLRYEKDNERINIVLSPKSSAISPESISFRDGKVLCDCAVALEVSNPDRISSLPGLEPSFFTEVPVINIDAGGGNGLYGEVNLVDKDKSSISEIVYELVTALRREPPDEDTATLIMTGIVSKTAGFRSPSTTPDSLLVASELMRVGARRADAFSLSGTADSVGTLQLFGRASVRSKLDQSKGILWSFLTAEDFEKTGTTPNDVSKVLSYLDTTFPPHRVTAAMWQSPQEKTVHTTLSGDSTLLEELRSRAGGAFQSPHLELPRAYSSFREAEDALTVILKEVL